MLALTVRLVNEGHCGKKMGLARVIEEVEDLIKDVTLDLDFKVKSRISAFTLGKGVRL